MAMDDVNMILFVCFSVSCATRMPNVWRRKLQELKTGSRRNYNRYIPSPYTSLSHWNFYTCTFNPKPWVFKAAKVHVKTITKMSCSFTEKCLL